MRVAPPERDTVDNPSAPASRLRDAHPGLRQTLGAIGDDYRRYFHAVSTMHADARARLIALLQYGFIATCIYRYGRWIRGIRPRTLSLPLKLIYHVLNIGVAHCLFGIRISPDSDIGPGLYIGHFGGIVVHGNLGAQCSLGQGVTIGAKGAGRSNGFPVIGDRVYLGAGAMVIGNIHVGNDVVVGANTVVVQDVPAGYRVVSAPARLLPGSPTPSPAAGDHRHVAASSDGLSTEPTAAADHS